MAILGCLRNTHRILISVTLFVLLGCSGPVSTDRLTIDTSNEVIVNEDLTQVVGEKDHEIPKESLEDGLAYPYQAPDFIGLTNWINSEPIASVEELRGKVVLIDFWTYACINCIRTLPHVQALYEKYGDQGFVVIGIHAPEFSYERKLENVQAAVEKYGLTYPVVQDNDFMTWRNYENRYWPAHYLIDKKGVVRATHFGEGAYDQTDRNVGRLLAE